MHKIHHTHAQAMKTLFDLIKENLKELDLCHLIELEQYVAEEKARSITRLTNLNKESNYLARKTLINQGFTHSEACKFLNEYID